MPTKRPSPPASRHQPKVAIFYDWLNQWGGAERVLLNILHVFPSADVYTLTHTPAKTPWLPATTKVTTSFIDRLPGAKNNLPLYTPLYALALEQFDLSAYDIVISTTSTVGHFLLTRPQTFFLCYFHNINRHLYLQPPLWLKPLLYLYRKIDIIASRRPDSIFCNSQTVAARLHQYYGLNAQIVHPGIDLHQFSPAPKPKNNYFLLVGRQVSHKRFDIVIKTFLNSPYQLVVVGIGREHRHLRTLAKHAPNINFAGQVTDQKLVELYQNCTALICPQLEDFGITPIEVQACGRPVIAYGQGGNTETIIPGVTGIFFPKQTAASLSQALVKFSQLKFNSKDCRKQAEKFSENHFMLNLKEQVTKLWLQHQTTMR